MKYKNIEIVPKRNIQKPYLKILLWDHLKGEIALKRSYFNSK